MRIVQDSREQAPYAFNAPKYAGVTVEVGTLQTGDYSLHGLTDRIALERKSLSDLCGTLTAGRERFKRECERGRGLEYFGLVIESSMDDVRRHLEHFLERDGDGHLALGGDLDGCDVLPDGMHGLRDYALLETNFENWGFGEQIVRNLFYQSLEKVVKLCIM